MATASEPISEELTLGLLNIRSLGKKTHHIRQIIAHHKLHVVALCETHLNASVKDSEVYIPGFRMWRRDRTHKSGGGVALYVQDHIEIKPRSDLMETEAEIIWVEMKLPEGRPVLLGCCYRPPDNLKHLVQIYETMDLVLKEKEKDILLMGDFNTDWDVESTKNVAKYVSSKWGLTQIVQDKTRIIKESSSCIDLIYTTIKDPKVTSTTTGCSDHNLVTAKLSRNVPKRFSRSNPDTQKFVKDKNNLKTGVKLKRAPLTALEHLNGNFLQLANQHSQLIQQNIYDTLKDASNEDSMTKADEEKQRIQEEQKNDHKRARDPDQSKDSLKKGLRVTEPSKTQIMEEYQRNKYDTILKICEEYFGERLSYHVINITQEGDVASDLYYLREEKVFDCLPVQILTDTFSFSELDDNEGRQWLESMLTDMKDADIPEIDAKLLNLSADLISDLIRHILNLCLKKCEFPSELKQFEFIPFSTRKLTKFRENRSLDSIHVMIGYIFDIILYKQAERHFIHKELIPSKSVIDQIETLKTHWLKAINSGETVSCLFLDFSSSFDSISHNLLLRKLKESGFSDSALDLIRSFLSYHEGSCGLNRGSFLARLLFTVFINDLKRLIGPSSAVICQNHMIVYTKHKNSETSEKQLEAKIQSVEKWATDESVSRFKRKRHNLKKELDFNFLFNFLLQLENELKLNWIQVLTEILIFQLTFKPKAVSEE